MNFRAPWINRDFYCLSILCPSIVMEPPTNTWKFNRSILFKAVVEIYLNLNIEGGGDTVLLHLHPLLLLLCLHLKEVGSQRSQNILKRKGDTHLLFLSLVILLKTKDIVSIKDLNILLLRLLTFIQLYSLLGFQRNHRIYHLMILCIKFQRIQILNRSHHHHQIFY